MKTYESYVNTQMSLLDLDNEFSTRDNLSLFGCEEGREAIEQLFNGGESDFSYEWDDTDNGICVKFKLVDKDEKPNSLDYEDIKDIEVIITSIYEH